MTQRRRLSRAQVAATPEREVRPGVSAATWWGDGAMPSRGAALSVEALREMRRVMMERSVAMPRPMVMPPWVMREAERFASDPYYPDDKADALPLVWQSAPDAWVRRAEAERRAVERTGWVLVAWLIGRWRRS